MDIDEEASGGGIRANESGDQNQGGLGENQFINNAGGDNQGGALADQDGDIKEEEKQTSGDNNTSRYSYLTNYLEEQPSDCM